MTADLFYSFKMINKAAEKLEKNFLKVQIKLLSRWQVKNVFEIEIENRGILLKGTTRKFTVKKRDFKIFLDH